MIQICCCCCCCLNVKRNRDSRGLSDRTNNELTRLIFHVPSFLTFSIFSISSHYSHGFILILSCCVFVPPPLAPHRLFPANTLNIALFSLFPPRSSYPGSASITTSTHRPAVISYGLRSKPRGREIKDSHCSQRPPRSKSGYISGVSLSHADARCTQTGKILSNIYTGTLAHKSYDRFGLRWQKKQQLNFHLCVAVYLVCTCMMGCRWYGWSGLGCLFLLH